MKVPYREHQARLEGRIDSLLKEREMLLGQIETLGRDLAAMRSTSAEIESAYNKAHIACGGDTTRNWKAEASSRSDRIADLELALRNQTEEVRLAQQELRIVEGSRSRLHRLVQQIAQAAADSV